MLMNMTLMMMLLDQWRTSTRNLEEQEGMESRPNVFYSSGNSYRNSFLKTLNFFAFFISHSIYDEILKNNRMNIFHKYHLFLCL